MAGEPHFETFDSDDGVRWRCQAANGDYTGHSVQAFGDVTGAKRAIDDHVRTVLAAAGVPDGAVDGVLTALHEEREIEHAEAE